MAGKIPLETPLQVRNNSLNMNTPRSKIALERNDGSKNEQSSLRSSCLENKSTSSLRKWRFKRKGSFSQQTQHKGGKRRRMTYSGYSDFRYSRKRSVVNSVALPTKFLLGGNITDPLNLKSLEDEEVNKQLNAFTPTSSPLPASKLRTQVKVLIPTNIYDPLNLNTGEEIKFSLICPARRKRKRHIPKSIKKEEKESAKQDQLQAGEAQQVSLKSDNQDAKFTKLPNPPKKNKTNRPTIYKSESRILGDKIVSPVVPQGAPLKFYKRFHSKTSDNVQKSNFHKKCKRRSRRSNKKRTQKSSNGENGTFQKSYYGSYPCCDMFSQEDERLKFFNKPMFCGKEILDVGCNVGHMSIYIAEHFQPKRVLGMDIDPKLIGMAHKGLLQRLDCSITKNEHFPSSMAICYGSVSRVLLPVIDPDPAVFPHNVDFMQANYVLHSNEELQMDQPEYDIILCLKVSKWIHLNWGDEGIKRSFKRMFTQLKCGGQLILQPQPWSSYAKDKAITPTMLNNYSTIKLTPNKFVDYLLSKEVGFNSCEIIGRIHSRKGYKLPLYSLTKSFPLNEDVQEPGGISPIVYNDAEWAHNSAEEQDSFCEWESDVISTNNSPSKDVLSAGNSESSHFGAYSENQPFLDEYYIFPSEHNNTEDSSEQ